MYGIATTALFTTLFRQIMPGALYMKQEVKFLAPLMIEEKVRVLIQVKQVEREKQRILFSTDAFKGETKLVTGEALIKMPSTELK